MFRMVLEKSSEERLVFLLTVSESAVKLQYGQPSSQVGTLTFSTQGRLTVDRWTHLALQVKTGFPYLSMYPPLPYTDLCFEQEWIHTIHTLPLFKTIK